MTRYKIKKSKLLSFWIMGVMFLSSAMVYIRLSIINNYFDFFFFVVAGVGIYGAYTLSKPFFSFLITDEHSIRVREGFKLPRIFGYRELESVMTDILQRRIIMTTADGRLFSFEYIYEDLRSFLDILASKGVKLKNDSRYV